MKTIELKNAYGSVTCGDGQLCFTHSATGECTYFAGGNEFVLYLGHGDETRVLPSSAFEFCGLEKGETGALFSYRCGKLSACVTYTAEEKTFVKRVKITSQAEFCLRRITTENRICSRPFTRGGEGQPVFAGNMWCGIEFPAACNYYEGDTLAFSQAPFEVCKEFVSLPVVYGMDFCGDLSRSFDIYISQKAMRKCGDAPLRVYCDWGLHDDMAEGEDKVELTEEMTMRNIERIAELSQKSGFKFDYYLMDAYWFEDNNPYTDFKKRTFPHGYKPVVDALEKVGMQYGLWFDLNFIYADLVSMAKYKKYSALLENKALCFSCDEVAQLLTDAIAMQIRRCGIKMIKLDFAYFECKNPAHGHSVEHVESKEKSIKNFLRMIRNLKELEPELKILCYNGWTTNLEWIGSVQARQGYAISPYWSEYVDYLYCGDPRPSEIACENMENSLVYYTDSMVRNFRESNIPFSSIDDHGIMSGQTSTIYWLGKKLFRAGVLMDVMRGSNKLNIYGEISDFNASDAQYLSFVGKLCDEIAGKGYRTEFIGGDVRKGEIYGYESRGASEGYAVLLNPKLGREKFTVKLSDCENSAIAVSEVIRDGEIVGENETVCTGVYTADISSNGYVLLKWELLPAQKSFDKTALISGDRITLDTRGKRLLMLSFTADGKPLRTPKGICDGLTVLCNGKEVEGFHRYVWSGVSWLCVGVSGSKSVQIRYDGQRPIWLKYQLTEAED